MLSLLKSLGLILSMVLVYSPAKSVEVGDKVDVPECQTPYSGIVTEIEGGKAKIHVLEPWPLPFELEVPVGMCRKISSNQPKHTNQQLAMALASDIERRSPNALGEEVHNGNQGTTAVPRKSVQ